jgi:hypothetical protein
LVRKIYEATVRLHLMMLGGFDLEPEGGVVVARGILSEETKRTMMRRRT